MSAERGVSLIELIIFIVVVSLAVIGVLAAINLGTRTSADPMVHKQALAIAEALLEEVQLQAFTWCDPDDANAATATGAVDCNGGPGGANDETKLPLAAEGGETRTSATTPFDHVSDYNGFSMTPITSIDGTPIAGLAAYTAAVTVANAALGTILAADGDAVRIQVTVTGPPGTGITVVLDGYRVRYAPNAIP